MTDAYAHLDMDPALPCPLADIESRMASAGIQRALLVETWDGRNRHVLDKILETPAERFEVALCYRKESSCELNMGLKAVRMSTEDIRSDPGLCEELHRTEKLLLTHAECGIGPLCREIERLHQRVPKLSIYVPHIAWPLREGKRDTDWDGAIPDLAAMPSVIIGISAIAHFSLEPFPHNDVRDLASRAISQIPAPRIVIGSDYPLFEKARYADYMSVAREWVTSIHPDWRSTF